jgi:hypothetical protein
MRSPRSLVITATLLGGFFTTSAASAMSLRTDLTVLAFSQDGASALVQVVVNGPEGGDQISYEVWSVNAPVRERFELSSDLSPGDGSHPQTVEQKACVERLNQLSAVLKRRGFKGATVQPAQCSKRGNFVTVDKPHLAEVDAALFRAKNKKLVHEDLEVHFRGNIIEIVKGDAVKCTITQPKRDAPVEIHVSGTKGGKLVYVLQKVSDGDEGLLGLCGTLADGVMKALPIDEAPKK